LERIGAIAGPDGEPGYSAFVAVGPLLADGRRIAYLPDTPGETPWIIDRSGHPTGRLGPTGDGPGEFRRVTAVLRGAGDSIFLFDDHRVHVLSPTLELVRSIPSPVRSTSYPSQLAGGKLALPTRTSGSKASVTVISAVDGALLWTVPADSFAPGSFPDLRVTASAPDGSLWTARVMRRLEFHHYSPDGVLLETRLPETSWFTPYDRYQPPTRSAPTSPLLRSFWVDSAGRAWVVAQVADLNWAKAEGEDRQGEGGLQYFEPKSVASVRDGLIDIIDLGSGKSLGSYRRDGLITSAAEFGTVTSTETNDEGWTLVELYRIVTRF